MGSTSGYYFQSQASRIVELKIRVLCWAEHGRVDDGQGGKRKTYTGGSTSTVQL